MAAVLRVVELGGDATVQVLDVRHGTEGGDGVGAHQNDDADGFERDKLLPSNGCAQDGECGTADEDGNEKKTEDFHQSACPASAYPTPTRWMEMAFGKWRPTSARSTATT